MGVHYALEMWNFWYFWHDKFMGFELDEKYYKIALERLNKQCGEKACQ